MLLLFALFGCLVATATAGICQPAPCDPAGQSCDWSDKGCVDDRVYQQKSDTCAAYTTYEILTARYAININRGAELAKLSLQMSLDCLHDGDQIDDADHSVTKYLGRMEDNFMESLVGASDYPRPYTDGEVQQCEAIPADKYASYRVSGTGLHTQIKWDELVHFVNAYGPVGAGLCMTRRFKDHEGCSTYEPTAEDVACGADNAHAVPVIGFERVLRTVLIKNSWGEEWDCGGYANYSVAGLEELVKQETEKRANAARKPGGRKRGNVETVISIFTMVSYPVLESISDPPDV